MMNKLYWTRKHEEWRKSALMPIYKNKKRSSMLLKLRRAILMTHAMKLWKKVIKQMLRRETKVFENQFDFM